MCIVLGKCFLRFCLVITYALCFCALQCAARCYTRGCATPCAPGFYPFCEEYGEGYPAIESCRACKVNEYQSETTGCCSNVRNVWHSVPPSCAACHAGSSTNGASAQAACTCSDTRLIWTVNGCVDRHPCVAGQYKTSIFAGCQTCPAKSTSPAGSGTYSVSICKCDAGHYKTSDAASCIICPPYSTSSAGSSDLSVSSCRCDESAGYINCAATTDESGCSVQLTSRPGVAHCTCRAGYYTETIEGSTTSTQGKCFALPPGRYKTETGFRSFQQTAACESGKYSTQGAATQPDVCIPCVVGSSSTIASSTCTLCTAGKFSEITGQPGCTNCPAGTYSTNSGAVSKTTCMTCPAGKTSGTIGATAATNCNACPPGSYNAKGRNKPCLPCMSHSTSPAESTSISACVCAPTYLQLQMTTSIACSGPCGCSQTAASDSKHDGVIVNGPGNYKTGDVCTWTITSTASILANVVVREGMGNAATQNAITPSVCSAVGQGLACIEHAPLQTLTDFIVTPNAHMSVQILRIRFRASADKQSGVHFELQWMAYGDRFNCIAPCPAGSRYVNSLCVLCDAGTFNLNPGHASTCTPCPKATYKTQAGAGTCTPCPRGEYSTSTGATSASLCLKCGDRTHPRSDGGGCEACASSYSASALSNAFAGSGTMPGCIEFVQ